MNHLSIPRHPKHPFLSHTSNTYTTIILRQKITYKLDKKSSQPPYILGHVSKSISMQFDMHYGVAPHDIKCGMFALTTDT